MAPTRTSATPSGEVIPPPPCRPSNAFFIFRSQKCKELKELGVATGFSGTQLSRLIGQVWRSMSKKDQERWYDAAKVESAEFDVEHPNYKYKPLPKGQKRVRPRARRASPLASTSTLPRASPSEYAGPSTSGHATPETTLNLPLPSPPFLTNSPGSGSAATPGPSYFSPESMETTNATPMEGGFYPPTPFCLPQAPPMFLGGQELLDVPWSYESSNAAVPWPQLDAEAAQFDAFCEALGTL